eukprot:5319928-Pyramimonas_sp.AAC.1
MPRRYWSAWSTFHAISSPGNCRRNVKLLGLNKPGPTYSRQIYDGWPLPPLPRRMLNDIET